MLRITKWGRRRVQSLDFKRALFEISRQNCETMDHTELAGTMLFYTATAMCADKKGRFFMDEEGKDMAEFLSSNDSDEVRKVLGDWAAECVAVGVATGNIPTGLPA